ncbi:MAG: hypothetical protein ABL309_01800 [Phycisphaerales bacterium]
MMRVTKARLVWMIGLFLHGIACSVGHAAQLDIDVSVSVVDSHGSPVADVPVVIWSPRQAADFAFTDASGVATVIDLPVSNAEGSRVVWAVIDDGFDVMPVVTNYSLAKSRLSELKAQYAIPSVRQEFFNDGQQSVSMTLVLTHGLSVQGRLVNSSGDPISGSVMIANSHVETVRSDPITGLFTLERVHPLETHRLFAFSTEAGYRSFGTVVELDANPASADVALGDVVLKSSSLNSAVSVKFEYAGEPPYDFGANGILPTPVSSMLTLVDSTDPDKIFYIVIEPETGMSLGPDGRATQQNIVPCPAGTFFIVPGQPTTELVSHVRSAIRAGASQDLIDAGLPRFQAPVGGSSSLIVDVELAFDAMEQYLNSPE